MEKVLKKSINASQAQSQALFPRFGGLGLVSSVAAAAILAACGGGGTDPAAPVTPPPVSNVQPSTIVTAVPTATYAAGSEELAAFNLLNAERQRCGFGLLAQNTKLDLAARDHATYQLINNVTGHFQNAAQFPIGFTGATSQDRVVFRGYQDLLGTIDEIAEPPAKNGGGVFGIRALLSGPYHNRGLVGGVREIGFSIINQNDAGSTFGPRTIHQVDGAWNTTTGKQQPTTNEVLTYPCDGTTGVNFRLRGEIPNPVPGRDLVVQPLGHPVVIRVRDGDVLALTSVTMVNSTTGAQVSLRSIVNGTNDPNGPGFYTLSDAYTIPDAPLAPNTSYRVTIDGTVNGAPFAQKSFTFTTGTGG